VLRTKPTTIAMSSTCGSIGS